MKKKKLATAKVQRPSQAGGVREHVYARRNARRVAQQITSAKDLLRRAGRAAEGSSEERRLLEYWDNACCMIGSLISVSDADNLRLVADAMDGNLKDYRVGNYDEKIKAVWNDLVLSRNGNGHVVFNPNVSCDDIHEAFYARTHIRCSSYSFHRALKRLGYTGPPPKRGGRRKGSKDKLPRARKRSRPWQR